MVMRSVLIHLNHYTIKYGHTSVSRLYYSHNDTCKYFAYDDQLRDSPVIVAVTHVPFVFVQRDYIAVYHVLRHLSLRPALAE